MDVIVVEIKWIVVKGCIVVFLNENLIKQELFSVYNEYWNLMWKVIVEYDMIMCLYIGVGNLVLYVLMEMFIEVWIMMMLMLSVVGVVDWLYLSVLYEYNFKVVLFEVSIGWVFYFLE